MRFALATLLQVSLVVCGNSEKALRHLVSARTRPSEGRGLQAEDGSGHDWLRGGRLAAGSCDHIDEAQCAMKPGCSWTEDRCHLRIAWFHVMKTGGSFGTTIAHYANSSLPRTAHMPSGKNQSDPEDRTTEGSQGEENFFIYKYPIQSWFKGVFWHADNNPANHVAISESDYAAWKGNFFGIFRQPERRARSAWHHFAKDKNHDLKDYARLIQGQQASMLSLGDQGKTKIWCEFLEEKRVSNPCGKLRTPNVQVAIQRLEGFAFVGLLEEYDLSVCLFHRMFGGECLPVEFKNMRPGSFGGKREQELELASLDAQRDPYDGPVYDAVSRRFWSDVNKYDVRRSTCLQTCPSAAHIFSVEEPTTFKRAANLRVSQPTGVVLLATSSSILHRGQGSFEYDWPGRHVFVES